MFGNKRIKALEIEVSRLSFILNNPPRYKVGDQIGIDCIISDVKCLKLQEFNVWYWRYETINIKNGKKGTHG